MQQSNRVGNRALRPRGCSLVATLTATHLVGVLEGFVMTISVLSDSDYHRLASGVLGAVEAQADQWLDQDVVDIDTHRTGGLLELSFPNGSKIVLNTQPPLHEIWLAARDGGFHFRFDGAQWVDTRDGQEFFSSLSRHASAQAGCMLVFHPRS